MKILRFREVKCVSNHRAGEMQSPLEPRVLPAPERFWITSAGHSSSAQGARRPATALGIGVSGSLSAALFSIPSFSRTLHQAARMKAPTLCERA